MALRIYIDGEDVTEQVNLDPPEPPSAEEHLRVAFRGPIGEHLVDCDECGGHWEPDEDEPTH